MRKIIAGAAVLVLSIAALAGCGGGKKTETQSDKCKSAATTVLNQFMATKTATDVMGLALLYSDGSDDSDLSYTLPACKPLSKSQKQEVEKQLKPLVNKVAKHVGEIVPLEDN